MEYRNLGRSGLKVSPLCLGAMMFGSWGNTDHEDSIRIIHKALDSGINFVDTANGYSDGESEVIVGKALKGRREGTVLATKVFAPVGPGPNQRGLSRKAIQEQVENSLRRLDTDVIDLYQIHRPDPTTPIEETLSTLSDLVRQGKVRYLGLSTNHYEGTALWEKRFAAWEIVETLWASADHGWERWISLQPPYSILRRVMEAEHFPMTLKHGIGNIVWSPLEGGWLSGKYRRESGNPKDSTRARNSIGDLDNPKFQRRLDLVEKLLPLAEAKDVPLARFANAWALRHPAVTSVIIGPRTMEQLEDSLKALDVQITDEDARRIDELVPPGTSAL
ncbi:MAG TPA: aldo/keto reductase [Thermoanaerobaculia bacterium]|jgi:aryl-alcohol dehydrogenase-like predicted oxidoreductase|nr:aldo/keto reductase [Thermoanaerobaculia bacterium]